MKRTPDTDGLHLDMLRYSFEEMKTYVMTAAEEGQAAHEVEREIWHRVLQVGHQALGLFFGMQGDGDVGETLALSDGRPARRLAERHDRPYQSVFGRFTLTRAVYGSREGQKLECVPLDTRLQLPESEFSYLLQEWDQALAVENPYTQVDSVLHRMLGFSPSVDSLERMNRQMGATVTPFRERQPLPPAEEEGALIVTSADGKGIPIRRGADVPPIQDHDRKKGPKPHRKKQAIVGTVYTIDPYPRTPEAVVESLFREPDTVLPDAPPRPHPCHKRVRASLNREADGEEIRALPEVFAWMAQQVDQRNPRGQKPLLTLMDGQASLWTAADEYLPDPARIDILDLLHVTPRLWEAAHLFYPSDPDGALAFVRERVTRVLHGNVRAVITGFRRMGTMGKLNAENKKKLEIICTYLEKNQARMRYDEYLAAGYPIASGVIEGACRHYVKDRMERAGMRWTIPGAQAMLDLRSTMLNGDWDAFTSYRLEQETQRLYPHADLIGTVEWPLAMAA